MMIDESNDEESSDWGRRRAIPLLGFLLCLVAATALFGEPRAWLIWAVQWVENAGSLGVLLYGAFYVLATLVFIPASILSTCAGFLFGLFGGMVLVSLATTLGAIAAFLISRYLARRQVQEKVAQIPKFQAIERAVSRDGFKMAFLTRLVPVLPFTILNYSFGLTRVSGRRFTTATWLGMIPTSLAYVYLGAAAGDLTRAMAMDEPLGPATYAMWAAATLSVVAIVWLITRRARRELAMIMDDDEV